MTPFDLHVLSTPPAFILSQDQTLYDIHRTLVRLLTFERPVQNLLRFQSNFKLLFELSVNTLVLARFWLCFCLVV